MTLLNGNPGKGLGVGAIPDLIYPNVKWDEADYASLVSRLDLYTDFIVLSKFREGAVSEQFLVNPDEVTAALAGLTLGSGLLPLHTLFWSKKEGQDRLGVYVPPQIWTVSVRNEPEAWRVPLPGLVVVGHNYDYSIWAVTERPTDANARLYLAPCPNVHPEGVCRGNAPFPQAGTATIWQAIDIFFSSRFNRDLSQDKSQRYPGCVLDQWRDLHQAGRESYPVDDLVEAQISLRRLIDAA